MQSDDEGECYLWRAFPSGAAVKLGNYRMVDVLSLFSESWACKHFTQKLSLNMVTHVS